MTDAESNRELVWKSHPLRDDCPRSIAALLALPAVTFLVLLGGFGTFLAALSLVVVAASLGRYFFPIVYRLDEEGVRLEFLGLPRIRKWSSFRNYYPHDIGVHLATGTKPKAIDAFQGLYLRYNGNREEVLDHVKRHIPSA